jgi:hypothetical protein
VSRGPGVWQGLLLDLLQRYDVVPVSAAVHHHLARDPTRTELVAARRAAARLAAVHKARAIWLGSCNRCGELSETWRCPACGAGCNRVLVLTKADDHRIRTVMPMSRHIPAWLSVASDASASEATLSEAVEH